MRAPNNSFSFLTGCVLLTFGCPSFAPTGHCSAVWAADRDAQDDNDATARRYKDAEIAKIEKEIQQLDQQRLDAMRRRDRGTAQTIIANIRTARERLSHVKKKSLDDYRAQVVVEQIRAEANEQQAKAKLDEQAQKSEKLKAFIDAGEKSGCPLMLDKPEALMLTRYLHANPGAPHVHSYFIPRNGMFPPGVYVRSTIQSRSMDQKITAWEVKADVVDAFGQVLASEVKQGVDLGPGEQVKFQIDIPTSKEASVVRLSVERTILDNGTLWQRQPNHRVVMWQIRKAQGPDSTLADVDLAPIADGGGLQRNDDEALSDRLLIGGRLEVGESLNSENGRYCLLLGDDGNLVFFCKADGRRLWASDTAGARAKELLVQQDGCVVLKREDGEVVWSSNTAGTKDAYIVAQPDGNLVIYTTGDRPVWASNTNE